ncbi:hypothetical protein [Rhizobium sp. AP16]|uniref:hypothetical protein n=1 Tax=Rhizobium sp. AP16 TaxID=1144306 RepID=UPI00026EE3FB|nr:hypothetical protein [Rhizobium sp. AP16]EJK88388.1 hypothetical protein PMI03_00547 [Rhizobium sp. AP16]
MTTIASTSYYTSATRYTGDDRSDTADADDAFALLSEQQETETDKAATDHSQAIVDSRPSTATVMLQGKLFTTSRIDVSDLKATKISELPEAEYQEHLSAMESMVANLKNQYSDWSWTDTIEGSLKGMPVSPATQPYATVVAGGVVIATIDNQGVVTSSDELAKKIQGNLPESLNGTNGPDLAQAISNVIAKMSGGRVEKASTAMTQSQFNALPPTAAPEPKIDYEAMKNDPWYKQLENLKQQRANFLAGQQNGVDATA